MCMHVKIFIMSTNKHLVLCCARDRHSVGSVAEENNPERDVQCRGHTEVMWCVYQASCLGSRADWAQAPE